MKMAGCMKTGALGLSFLHMGMRTDPQRSLVRDALRLRDMVLLVDLKGQL